MKRQNDCAFPADSKTQTDGGLTVREYFAAKAMQGLLSIYDDGQNAICPNEDNVVYMANLAVKAADELLRALAKTEA